MPTPSELLQGTVDIIILRTLAWQPMHGYAMTRFIREKSGDEIVVDGAALYQALHRLERRKLVKSSWGTSAETGRRVRVYDLTAAGRKALAADSEAWHRYAAAVRRVLSPA
jgi:PadR family transcriptional regulator, regulatory protein PadR